MFCNKVSERLDDDNSGEIGDGTGCEFGDRASWCPTYISSNRDCYNEGDICCQSCEPYRVNISGDLSASPAYQLPLVLSQVIGKFQIKYRDYKKDVSCHVFLVYFHFVSM